MTTKMTRRGFASVVGVSAIALASTRLTFAHGDEDHGTPEAEATPQAVYGSGTAAAWFTITNTGERDDRLVSATSDAAAAVELHEMVSKDGVMTMAPLPDGLAIPAGETVTLEPGGQHFMLIGLARDLKAGESFALELTFESAGMVEVTVPIFVSEGAAAEAELEPVEFGDLEITGIWSRHAPALLDSATPVASPSH